MLHSRRPMAHFGTLLVAIVTSITSITACTTPNPLDCADGTCTDPAHPFCDVDGSLGDGTLQSCIAVSCTPGTTKACRNNSALVCNRAGTDYDITQCANGCDPDVGCRLCEANQTVCANGTVQSCDANGAVTSSQTCSLGCFEDQPHCTDIAPSNNLAMYLDMAANEPDLALADGTIEIPSDRASGMGTGELQLHGFTIPAPLDGVSIHVIPLRSLSLSGTVRIITDGSSNPAIAFVVAGPVDIAGHLIIGDVDNEPPGAVSNGACVGEVGMIADIFVLGSGGGGSAEKGGNGGGQIYPARKGGVAFDNPDLQPLRGGCDGGRPPSSKPGSGGGGAIQITSRTKIHLVSNASIEANGQVGYAVRQPVDEALPGGGGGGGAILLEAPEVMLGSGAILAANGGAGTNGLGDNGAPASGSTPSFGATCGGTSPICTKGGDGGAISNSNIDAPSVVPQGAMPTSTGAGGGAIGYIRINTSTGTYLKPGDGYQSPVPSTGSIMTR